MHGAARFQAEQQAWRRDSQGRSPRVIGTQPHAVSTGSDLLQRRRVDGAAFTDLQLQADGNKGLGDAAAVWSPSAASTPKTCLNFRSMSQAAI